MTDEPIRYIKMEPEFVEIISHIHFESIGPRRSAIQFEYEYEYEDEEDEGNG